MSKHKTIALPPISSSVLKYLTSRGYDISSGQVYLSSRGTHVISSSGKCIVITESDLPTIRLDVLNRVWVAGEVRNDVKLASGTVICTRSSLTGRVYDLKTGAVLAESRIDHSLVTADEIDNEAQAGLIELMRKASELGYEFVR